MKIYYNAASQSTFTVSNEYHRIENSKITLDYVPLVESITILGLVRTNSNTPRAGEFYVDYRNDQYAIATPDIYFNTADNGKHINVDYRGVMLVAEIKNVDEIKTAVSNLLKPSNANTNKCQAEIAGLFVRPRKKQGTSNNITYNCACEDLQSITNADIQSLFT